jgi:putative phosphoesterase
MGTASSTPKASVEISASGSAIKVVFRHGIGGPPSKQGGTVKRIGIISDTHGQVDYTQEAVRLLESLEVELVIHCGDIGSAAIVRQFSAWPTHFVFGNVDADRRGLRRTMEESGQTCHDCFGSLELEGVRIAFLHGDDTSLLETTIHSGDYDLVCHGHTHVARQVRQGKTLVLNPGAIYRANPHSFAIVELPALDVLTVRV